MAIGIGAGIIIASAIGGIASLIGSSQAASAQKAAASSAEETQLQMYYQAREDQAPWREAGGEAVNALTGLIEAGPGEFKESPGYEFTRKEGLRGIRNVLSSMGQVRSGRHIKAATRYAEGLASTEYDNFLSRWYQSLTPYQSLAGLGQTSVAQTGAAGTQAGQGAAMSQLYGGDAAAAGWIGGANTLTNLASGGLNTYLQYNALKNLKPKPKPYGMIA